MNTPPLPEGFIPQEMADPAELRIGPFYKHRSEAKTLLWPTVQHTNTQGIVHGGVLMTFADFTLASTAMRTDASCITVNMNCNFVGNTEPGNWILGEAEINRWTNRMVFVSGVLRVEEKTLLTFSGIGKRVKKND